MFPTLSDISFVGREHELEAYRKKLQDLRQQKNLLLNLHGLTGMGKTWLAYKLFQETRKIHACAWLSFEPNPVLPFPGPPYQEQSVYDALSACLSASPLAVFPHDEFDLNMIRVLKEIPVLADVAHYSQPYHPCAEAEESYASKPFLLIIDGIDQLDRLGALLDLQQHDDFWDFLQNRLIKPLINHQSSLVICVSQVPIEWSYWELQVNCDRSALEPLSLKETQEILAKYQLGDYSSIIYSVTHGHPATLSYLISRDFVATTKIYPRPPEQRDDLQHARSLEVKRQIAALANSYARDLIRLCGILRCVEHDIINDLLQALSRCNMWHFSISRREINQAIEEWYKHGIILYRFDEKIFVFAREIREVITDDFQQPERIEQFLELCITLRDQYLKRWQEKPRTKREYFGEWAYFSLRVTTLTVADMTTPSADEEVAKWLEEFRTHWQRLGAPASRTATGQGSDHSGEDRKFKEFKQEFAEDPDIQALASTLGIDGQIQQQTLDLYPRWNEPIYHEKMVHALAEYLFRERFPRALSKSEQSLLIYIARNDSLQQGFTLQELQNHLTRDQTEFAVLSPRRLQAYINLYRSIYALQLDERSRKFVMNSWLRKFLQNDLLN